MNPATGRAPASGSGRLFLAEAAVAAGVEDVRRIWLAARAAGQPRWYLDRIAAVGRARSDAGPVPIAA
ncbi:hypothetical protein ACFC1T_02120 [Kitasatospora sp. NPDC056076]|uniref:hypothetical protein n=1 Tax=Streptomycetaceae TaxID=2062 RepID=UPI0035DBA67F